MYKLEQKYKLKYRNLKQANNILMCIYVCSIYKAATFAHIKIKQFMLLLIEARVKFVIYKLL